ncbi:glutamyl-tRNA(Gln) amidotransferase subunit B, mitochondrial isoform X2 [Halyomorpha halys]|uniref:glutamyl-tRNA(Gln) amidotransferase subunit B, mitochondrial isoform X2 n=1 Tax=Halyomorpha halys TaxID=286706 RepID=UPI0006D4F413
MKLVNFIRGSQNRNLGQLADSIIAKKRKKWLPVVGLEIHVQLNSHSKLFSASSTIFGTPANTNVSLFDAAIPGTLPVLNRRCVELGVSTALALSCQVNPVSFFDRKHYFYADLPAGYQITQQRAPLACNGHLEFPIYQPGVHKKPYTKHSKILQVQLEQDSGKSLYDSNGRNLVDLNRAGVPLIEIVFAPDLSDGYEAAALVKELILILRRLKTCSCKMEEGALRVDANISVHKDGEKYGVRTEIKNIGSIRGVTHAVNYEIKRQVDVLESGGVIINETRAWDASLDETVPMRDKEMKQDYRFMPEPNLPPLRLDATENANENINVSKLRQSLPELPAETREKVAKTYNLLPETVLQLVREEDLFLIFNQIMNNDRKRNVKTVSSILLVELMTLINKGLADFNDGKFNEVKLGSIVDLIQSGDINLNIAKLVMEEIANGNNSTPEEIITALGLWQIKDTIELTRICTKVVQDNPEIVNQYKKGKTKVFAALLGKVAVETNKKAKMDVVVKLLKEMLKD